MRHPHAPSGAAEAGFSGQAVYTALARAEFTFLERSLKLFHCYIIYQ